MTRALQPDFEVHSGFDQIIVDEVRFPQAGTQIVDRVLRERTVEFFAVQFPEPVDYKSFEAFILSIGGQCFLSSGDYKYATCKYCRNYIRRERIYVLNVAITVYEVYWEFNFKIPPYDPTAESKTSISNIGFRVSHSWQRYNYDHDYSNVEEYCE